MMGLRGSSLAWIWLLGLGQSQSRRLILTAIIAATLTLPATAGDEAPTPLQVGRRAETPVAHRTGLLHRIRAWFRRARPHSPTVSKSRRAPTRHVRRSSRPEGNPPRRLPPVGDPGPDRVRTAAHASRSVPARGAVQQAEFVTAQDTPAVETAQIAGTNVELACLAPATVNAGSVFVQRIVVRNAGTEPLVDALLEARFSLPVEIVDPGPDGKVADNGVVWRVAKLAPGEQRELRVLVSARGSGALRCRVTLSTSASVETVTSVHTVQLAARLDGPELVTRGEQLHLNLVVRNQGNATARGVVVRYAPEGPQAASGDDAARFEVELGNLPPGAERTVQVPVLVMKQGQIRLKLAVVTADGHRTEAVYEARVRAPKLAVDVEGPTRWLPKRRATLSLRVRNEGDAAAEQAELLLYVARGLRIGSLPEGARVNRTLRTVTIPLGELPTGAEWHHTIELEPERAGTHLVRLCVVAANGEPRKLDYHVRARGVPALNVEIRESRDPVLVDETLTYEIVLTNTGTAAAHDVSLAATWTGAFRAARVSGTVAEFDPSGRLFARPIPVLNPGQSVRIRVEGVATKGDGILLRAEATSPSCPLPARDEQSTVVAR